MTRAVFLRDERSTRIMIRSRSYSYATVSKAVSALDYMNIERIHPYCRSLQARRSRYGDNIQGLCPRYTASALNEYRHGGNVYTPTYVPESRSMCLAIIALVSSRLSCVLRRVLTTPNLCREEFSTVLRSEAIVFVAQRSTDSEYD